MQKIWHDYKVIIMACLGSALIVLMGFGICSYASKDEEKITNNTEKLSFSEQNIEEESKVQEEKVLDSFYVEVKGQVVNPGVYSVNKGQIINDLINLAGGFNDKAYTDNINLSYELSKEMVVYVYEKNAATPKVVKAKTTTSSGSSIEPEKEPEKTLEQTKTCQSSSYVIENCLEEGESIIETTISPDYASSNNTEESTAKEDLPAEESSKNNEPCVEPEIHVLDNFPEDLFKAQSKALVNINEASQDQLMTLSGIGQSKALKIIEYRNTHGPFKTISEIKNVSGIGDAVYAKIKAYITV